jgi:hypothetical protein
MTKSKVVELGGKCVIKIKTGYGSSLTTEVPRVSLKTGKNNADSFIREVIHFGVMRHGLAQFRELVEDKLSMYEDNFTPDVIAELEKIKE